MLTRSEIASGSSIEFIFEESGFQDCTQAVRGLTERQARTRLQELVRNKKKESSPGFIERLLNYGNSSDNRDEFSLDGDLVGINELIPAEEESLFSKYLGTFKDPLIMLLSVSAIISAIVKQYDDAISILLAVTIVGTVGFVQEYRSEQSLKELKRLVPHGCIVIRDGKKLKILARDLVHGDVVELNVGDRVPADVRLMDAVEFECDESSLTGESDHTCKSTNMINDRNIAISDRNNVAFMGTLVKHGHAKGVVVAIGEETEIGIIFSMLQDVEETRTPLQCKMDELGTNLTKMSFGIIFVIFLVGWLQNKSALDMFQVSVSLAVAAIPEGLPIVVTVTLALGIMRMSSKNAIVKKLPVVEVLGATHVICTDKTGTITHNVMTVSKFYTEQSGVYDLKENETVHNGRDIDLAIEVGLYCNNAHVDGKLKFGQPTEVALINVAKKYHIDDKRLELQKLNEVPFSSETKYMMVEYMRNGQKVTYMKGMTCVVLNKCTQTVDKYGKLVTLQDTRRQELNSISGNLAKQGLRVLALASGPNTNNLVFNGFVGINDPPREGVHNSIIKLHNAHVQVVMITGDSRETACKIAETVGIYDQLDDKIMSGSELENMTTDELSYICQDITVFYRTAPAHKLTIIEAFQKCGKVVAMTGDGVNDTLAMKKADIGIAMGKNGLDVTREAADMILVDDDFNTIVAAVEEGKGIFHNIQNFVRFQLSTSMAALTLITLATLLGFPNPLNAMQILWINIIMDGPPAQSLGVEKINPNIMKNPPRAQTDPVITKQIITTVVFNAAVIVCGTLYVFYSELTDNVITARATTMAFTTFVMFDMFCALSCRSVTESVFKVGLYSNKFFLFAVGGSIMGQLMVIYLPPLQAIFQTEALSFGDLCFIVLLSSSIFWMEEMRKMTITRNPKFYTMV